MDESFDRAFLGYDKKESKAMKRLNIISLTLLAGFFIGVAWTIKIKHFGVASNAPGMYLSNLMADHNDSADEEIEWNLSSDYKEPIKPQIKTAVSFEWVPSFSRRMTTTAYPPDEDGDFMYADGSMVEMHHYTIALSRDLENTALPDGRVVNLREKVPDPFCQGRYIYKYRAYVPGYNPLNENGTPDTSKLSIPRDRVPRTIWINSRGAKTFGQYELWAQKGLFLDARGEGRARNVRVLAHNWIDVLYTHPNGYGTINNRCLKEWGTICPTKESLVVFYELKRIETEVVCE